VVTGTVQRSIGAAVLAALAFLAFAQPAAAKPAPEIEFTYNVAFRRHYQFPNNDAVGYGRTICDAMQRGDTYGVVVADVRNEITPNDEESVNYLVSNAVDILCPAQIWELRQSAAGYRPER